MYAVGMLGSYLTQGVYAIAGPFQPFGCAVDIIVVQQEDGTFKSSPWYVKFGDFHGGHKGIEERVAIRVNDVRADFHMFLDNKGEACFEKEVELDEGLSDTSLCCDFNGAAQMQESDDKRTNESTSSDDDKVGIPTDDASRNAMLMDTTTSIGSKAMQSKKHNNSMSLVNDISMSLVIHAPSRATELKGIATNVETEFAHFVDRADQNFHFSSGASSTVTLEMSELSLDDDKCTTDSSKMTSLEFFNAEPCDESESVASAEESCENEQASKNEICTDWDEVVNGEENASALEKSMSAENVTGLTKEEIDSQTSSMGSPPSRWNVWPLSFRRSRASSPTPSFRKEVASADELEPKNGGYKWPQKSKVRTYVPTSAQLASLKLTDGPNKVTFIFSSVAGKQTEVDARIYLWKWNTRIVISDVDGTITKSDVLGQVMPLVGRDWSQSGVTRLFSAIKDNGYELLFLSARAISQAYLTRQFLLNLKQDGETLPEGPMFISPDGIFPSLYREVIRRTPHEFKISCLEDIQDLFPQDSNPFYAGFGNRNTDEISYLKVGIPKGKIFIINPKGEVMVNHVVRTYTSLLAFVDEMFPPMPSFEQEAFNSWNFWKLPLPDVEMEFAANSMKSSKKHRSLKK